MPKSYILERRNIAKDRMVFEEGEPATNAFIVQAGKLRVFSEHNGKEIEFSILKPGDIFGEMALIGESPRSANVQAIEDCNLIVITYDVFEQKLKASDPTIQAIVRMFKDRLVQSNEAIIKSKGVNIDNFIELLNQLFRDLLEAMPDDKRDAFKSEAFPAMKQVVDVIEKYRDYLE